MSLPLTHAGMTDRCLRLAKIIADELVRRQKPDGDFVLPDFYGKAFACALWSGLDRDQYHRQIDRAQIALQREIPDKTYHREFIEYALLSMPGMSATARRAILKNARNQNPDVANWQILQLRNRQTKTSGAFSRLSASLHRCFICMRYWRSNLFLDRPGCFSAQYHAFCAALLSQSANRTDQALARKATHLIASICQNHGYANLAGRGAGQSFGAVCAFYVLLKYGFHDAADAVLYRIEDAMLNAATLPLNLLAPCAVPENPGPTNRLTPGWYGYNRHDDYLAFGGYWLLQAAGLSPETPQSTMTDHPHRSRMLFTTTSAHYDAQMLLSGARIFDVTPAPVIVSGKGSSAMILSPPTGGEQDQSSLYVPATIPLPATRDGTVARFITATCQSDRRVVVTYQLAGTTGQRIIDFDDTEIRIADSCDERLSPKPDLLRILATADAKLNRVSDTELAIAQTGIRLMCDHPIVVDDKDAITVAGPAQRITAPKTNNATLIIRWENRQND